MFNNWVNVVSRDEVRRIVLELIRTDEEFRLAIAGALGLEAILNELRALRQDFNAMLNRVVSIEEARRECVWVLTWREELTPFLVLTN